LQKFLWGLWFKIHWFFWFLLWFAKNILNVESANPSILKADDSLFVRWKTMCIFRSENLADWSYVGNINFTTELPKYIPSNCHLCAPFVLYINNQYILYFSINVLMLSIHLILFTLKIMETTFFYLVLKRGVLKHKLLKMIILEHMFIKGTTIIIYSCQEEL
jgi:hypothetical protein